MLLVMFKDAIRHVSRISRVIRQPMGNALLLGIGGSGRQSLTRLATFMAEYECYQVEIAKGYNQSQWREDLRTCLLKAGLDNKQVVFLFNDTQIVFESMLEDVNNILNSGDVPNLYAAEDLDQIYTTCRIDCQKKRIPPTKLNIFGQYVNRVRQNIHVVTCMSPIGEAFRTRLRMFPSLVNCCTIDWFSEWPDEALKSVADSAMRAEDMALGGAFDGVVEMFKNVHQSVAKASLRYLAMLGRNNYVTPTSYLELLDTCVVLPEGARVGWWCQLLRPCRKRQILSHGWSRHSASVFAPLRCLVFFLRDALLVQLPSSELADVEG
jgi:dynein heavy chain